MKNMVNLAHFNSLFYFQKDKRFNFFLKFDIDQFGFVIILNN